MRQVGWVRSSSDRQPATYGYIPTRYSPPPHRCQVPVQSPSWKLVILRTPFKREIIEKFMTRWGILLVHSKNIFGLLKELNVSNNTLHLIKSSSHDFFLPFFHPPWWDITMKTSSSNWLDVWVRKSPNGWWDITMKTSSSNWLDVWVKKSPVADEISQWRPRLVTD